MSKKKQDSSSQSLQNLFFTAMKKANTDCIFANNKIEQHELTHGWSELHFYHSEGEYLPAHEISAKNKHKLIDSYNPYSKRPKQWYYSMDPLKSMDDVRLIIELYEGLDDPMEEKRLDDDPEYKRLWHFVFRNNLIAKHMRFGNCGTRSAIVFSYLWQHASPLVKNIKFISMSYDHAVVMVNDEWIIDPWYKDGVIYPISEFPRMAVEVREYCLTQLQEFRDQNLLESEESSWETHEKVTWRTRYEVCPQKMPYPKYAYGMSMEDHFSLRNIYPRDIVDEIDELEEDHRKDFQPVLSEFNFFWKNRETHIKPLQAGLFSAIQAGNINKVVYFLNQGADINCKNNMEQTPLMAACVFEHQDIIKLLVDEGADVNACSSTNLTALGIAVYQDAVGIAKFLLNEGANPDIITSGFTLEAIALNHENEKMASLLNKPVLVPLPKPSKSYKKSAQNFFQRIGQACTIMTEFMVLGKK